MFAEESHRLTLGKDDYLTKNFKLKEFCVSDKYEYLVPSLYLSVNEYTENLFNLCHFILQPIRDKFKAVIRISSGFRNERLNLKLGSGSYSLHLKGKAADIYVDDPVLLPVIFDWIKKYLKGRYGELLLYKHKDGTPNFIHVSLPEHGRDVKIDSEVIK